MTSRSKRDDQPWAKLASPGARIIVSEILTDVWPRREDGSFFFFFAGRSLVNFSVCFCFRFIIIIIPCLANLSFS